MDNLSQEAWSLFQYIRWALFATIGGAVGYTLRSPTINLRDCIIESVGAGFVGALVSMACQAYSVGTAQTGILVGVSALVGARASLRFLQTAVMSRLKIQPAPAPEEEENGKPN